MESSGKTQITIETTVKAPVSKVWEYWNAPTHITKWATASEDWHTPRAENDLRPGGQFSNRMEAKDGSFGFDFGGTYDSVTQDQFISYTLGDSRRVEITFKANGDETHISETFEAEEQNPVDMQRGGWQAILDNFKRYVEGNG